MKLGIPQAMTFYIDHQEEIREAKEMEKEQTIDFAMKFMMQDRPVVSYYNETYGDDKK